MAAELLFMERGFKSVTLDDVALALKMKKASLYYHFPEGKEQLFMAVLEKCFDNHRKHYALIVNENFDKFGLQTTLVEIGKWICSQPAMNTSRLLANDTPLLNKKNRKRIFSMIESMVQPIAEVFGKSQSQNLLSDDPKPLLGMYFCLIESIHQSHLYTDMSSEQVLNLFMKVYFFGALKTGSPSR